MIKNNPTSTIKRGYPNIALIRDSFRTIYSVFSAEELSLTYVKDFVWQNSVENSDPIILVQIMVKAIASHFGIAIGTINVSFHRNLGSPAKVQYSHDNNFFIEVEDQYASKPNDLVAILGHEVSHIVIWKKGIKTASELSNEILTDTIAIFLGFGVPVLESFRIDREEDWLNRKVTVTTQHLGYLTPDETAYVLSKRAFAFHNGKSPKFKSLGTRAVYDLGERRFNEEQRSAPFKKAGLISKFIYRNELKRYCHSGEEPLKAREYKFEKSSETSVIICCPLCSKLLRLPVFKKIRIRCQGCLRFWNLNS